VVARAPPSLAQAIELLLYHLRSVAVALRVWGFQSSIAGLRINPKANFLYAIACGRIFGFEILSTVTVNDGDTHIAETRLVPLLQKWSAPYFFLCYPTQRQMPPVLLAFIDHVRI
jgi:hypothetical protein